MSYAKRAADADLGARADALLEKSEDAAEPITPLSLRVSPEAIRFARETIAYALAGDDDLRIGYQANVAMLLHDRYGITDYETRNKAANDILNKIFDMDCEPLDL